MSPRLPRSRAIRLGLGADRHACRDSLLWRPAWARTRGVGRARATFRQPMSKRKAGDLFAEQRRRVLASRDEAFADPPKIAKLDNAMELHHLACWSDAPANGGSGVLTEIVRDARCDLGTAVTIYWRFCKDALRAGGEPFHAERREIEERIASGFYKQRTIRYESGIGPDEEIEIAGRKVPGELLLPTPGELPPVGIGPVRNALPREVFVRRAEQGATARVLLAELERGPDEDFATYWQRTNQLKRRLVDDRGPAGMEIWLQHEGLAFDAVHALDTVPQVAGCPWRARPKASAADTINALFGPLAERLPRTVALLEGHTRHLFGLQRGEAWFLLYLVDYVPDDSEPCLKVYVGGAPSVSPALPASAVEVGWAMPEALASFYAVHDGFGELDATLGQMGGPCVLGSHRVATLRESVDPDGVTLTYDFEDLLEVFPDGSGNTAAFHRRSRTDGDPPIVSWDHETWELHVRGDFFAYVDQRLVFVDDAEHRPD
jgi:hypothetical protein